MKRTLITIMTTCAAMMIFAAEQNDFRLTLSTKGPDSYAAAPKRTVLDGEFYALVWTKTADTPVVFKADGSVQDGAELVVCGPWAKDGRCGYVLHQISQADMAHYSGGVFRLVALDTRKADGTLSGFTLDADGYAHPTMVNGYSLVASMTMDAALLSAALDIHSPINIATTSELPEGTPEPVITDMQLRQGVNGQELVIRVKGTAPYLNYTAALVTVNGATSETPAISAGATGATTVNDEIEIVVPATDNFGLFKIIRK